MISSNYMNKRFDKPNEINPIEQGLQRIHHHIFQWIFSDRCLSAKLNTHVYAKFSLTGLPCISQQSVISIQNILKKTLSSMPPLRVTRDILLFSRSNNSIS